MFTNFSIEQKIVSAGLNELLPLSIIKVEGTEKEKYWDYLVNKYHYLGCKGIIGKKLKYLVFSKNQIIAASGWKSGSLKLQSRDWFIGWDSKQKDKYLDNVVDNTRYLIMPNVEVFNLASYLLARIMKRVTIDWQDKYGKEIFLCETFIDPRYFHGSCYKAANWQKVGESKGYGKTRNKYEYHGQIKEVYIYVVKPNFRTIIGCDGSSFSQKLKAMKQREERTAMILQNMDYHPELIDWQGLIPDVISQLSEELAKFCKTFSPGFRRIEQSMHGQIFIKGLLSNIERKNVERIALQYLEPKDVRGMQHFLTTGIWDEEWIKAKGNEILAENVSGEDGMITVDSSETAKKGKESVGVARQYNGNSGKIDNCQSGVYTGYTSSKGYGLIDARLYLPEVWFSDEYKERWERCRIPPDIKFKTKIEIALEEIQGVNKSGLFAGKWVGGDATFGSDVKFRDEIAKMGKYYFVGIKENQLVWIDEPKLIRQSYKGIGRYPDEDKIVAEVEPIHVKDVIKNVSLKWETVVLAEGSKGPIITEVSRIRVYECRDKLPGGQQWLFLRKDSDGKIKPFLSNAPANTSMETLIRVCTYRWPIEQCFEDGKKYLGMDHYEHRSWVGWHRHMIFIMITLLFLLTLRLKYKKKFQRTRCRRLNYYCRQH